MATAFGHLEPEIKFRLLHSLRHLARVERHRDILLIVAPSLRNDHDLVPRAEIGGFSPRSAGAPPKRNDGATISRISLRRSTPTPPGGVTQPVVGVAPAVLAPRRAPPVPAEDPPRGRPGGATSVSCTSFYHSFDHSLDTVAQSLAEDSLSGNSTNLPRVYLIFG